MKGGVCDAKAVPRNDGDVYAKGQWWMQATAIGGGGELGDEWVIQTSAEHAVGRWRGGGGVAEAYPFMDFF